MLRQEVSVFCFLIVLVRWLSCRCFQKVKNGFVKVGRPFIVTVPIKFPFFITKHVFACTFNSFNKCVDRKMVFPCLVKFNIISFNSFIPSGSSPLKGSSHNKYSGLPIIDRARLNRFFIPVESALNGFSRALHISHCLKSCFISADETCFICRMISAISKIVSEGSVVNGSVEIPNCFRRKSASVILLRLISPSSGLIRPATRLNNVVFPEPLSPTKR